MNHVGVLGYGVCDPSAFKMKGSIALNSNSFQTAPFFYIVVVYVSHMATNGSHQGLRFMNREYLIFPLLFFQRNPYFSLCFVGPIQSVHLSKLPSLHPGWFSVFAMLPQLCVPRNTPRTCSIFIKLNIWRFLMFFISKFMVFNVELNHGFYFVESSFYFQDFKALNSFRVYFIYFYS